MYTRTHAHTHTRVSLSIQYVWENIYIYAHTPNKFLHTNKDNYTKLK